MKSVLASTIFFLSVLACNAQSDITTFIFVRHAEKADDGTKDPALKQEGRARVQSLMTLLKAQKIDAVLSTNFKRTLETVTPLADAKGLKVETYESLQADQLASLAAKHKGGTVLICGHSNTTPKMVNALVGSEEFKQFDDSDHGNLIVVSVNEVGKGKAVTLRY